MAVSQNVRPRPDAAPAAVTPRRSASDYVWAAVRISLGTVFMWAFLDKLFGLGHETASAKAWLNGGSPTKGFLSHSTGMFSGLFKDLAGNTVIDWLFMLALVGLGTALILGIGMRIAAVAGVLLLVGMWAAVLPPQSHIFMDDHIIYALVLVGLVLVGAGKTVGLGGWWSNTTLVTRNPWLN
jgi:thiosulfate dehydrogenase (quinone) large subunit